MTCPYCQQPAEDWLEPDRNGEPVEKARCYACCRERVVLRDGTVKWLLMGQHCRKCGAALWRHARHGRYGHVVYLWPDPSHVTARHFVYGADGALQPYCAGCAPALGDPPPHTPELDAEPITLGAVIGYEDTPTRYAASYLPRYGRFLEAWLRDTLALDADVVSALVAQWNEDVHTIRRDGGAPTETP